MHSWTEIEIPQSLHSSSLTSSIRDCTSAVHSFTNCSFSDRIFSLISLIRAWTPSSFTTLALHSVSLATGSADMQRRARGKLSARTCFEDFTARESDGSRHVPKPCGCDSSSSSFSGSGLEASFDSGIASSVSTLSSLATSSRSVTTTSVGTCDPHALSASSEASSSGRRSTGCNAARKRSFSLSLSPAVILAKKVSTVEFFPIELPESLRSSFAEICLSCCVSTLSKLLPSSDPQSLYLGLGTGSDEAWAIPSPSESPRESDGSRHVPKPCTRTSGKGSSLAGEAESADRLGLLLDLASLSA